MPSNGRQRRVRFAHRDTFYSPRVPSLTVMSPTPASTGLITPPMSHGLPGPSPYTTFHALQTPRKFSHYVGPFYIHPLLQTSLASWDLMEKPSSVTWNNQSLSGRVLCEKATTPPLPFLSITSVHLPWIINTYASNGSYVTLGDIFNSIYYSLRTNITAAEFNSLPHKNDQRKATRAYEQRHRRLRSICSRDAEKRGGMKRIDFLMGHTKFQGISKTGPRPDQWRLNVA